MDCNTFVYGYGPSCSQQRLVDQHTHNIDYDTPGVILHQRVMM